MPSLATSAVTYQTPPAPPETYGPYVNGGYGSARLPALSGAEAESTSLAPKQYPHFALAPATSSGCLSNMPSQFPPTLLPGSHPATSQHASVGASLLPPIRIPDIATQDFHQRASVKRSHQAPSEKEEKVGGVAAYLDYEIDDMVDFVSEMAQGMYEIFASRICLADIDMARSVLNSRSAPTQDFRKFVSQVLSSTRLPSSTVLLGLLYLSKRMVTLSSRGHYGQSGLDIRSILIMALVLGSKFLDDNTFQNRSWAEVSNIPVNKLNLLEFQWLSDIQWNLHIDQEDPDGFRLWLQLWNNFQNRRVDLSLVESLQQIRLEHQTKRHYEQARRLPPLDTALIDSQTGYSSCVIDSFQPHRRWNHSQHLEWQLHQSHYGYSPPSAPETGPTTPDAQGFLDSNAYTHQAFQSSFKLPPSSHLLPSNANLTDYYAPYTSSAVTYMRSPYDAYPYNTHHSRSFMACA